MRVDFSKNDYFTTDPAYQWDLNQTLEIVNHGLDVAPVIHFSNKEMDEAILVQSEMSYEGVITCPVPNILLKDKYNIIAWLSNMSNQQSTTEYKIEIPVYERVQPKDYYYTNNVPILTYEAIEADIQTYFNRSRQYTDEAVFDLENMISTVEQDVDQVEEDVEEIQFKMPFRFGIDIDGNYGYIPDGDENVVPFAQNGILEVQSTTTNKSITVKSKGKAHCDMTVTKRAGAPYTYTLTVNKNGSAIHTETYNGDAGEYKLMVDTEVEVDDVLEFKSSQAGNLDIYATVYVTGSGINPSGTGLPIWNSVLARMDNMENTFVVPTVADKTDDTVIYFDPDNEELDIAEMSDLDKLDESIAEIRSEYVKKEYGLNLLNISKAQNGFIANDTGNITPSDSYITTEFIPVKNGEPISFGQYSRKFLAYDSEKNPITSSYIGDSRTNWTYIPTQDGFVRYSIGTGIMNDAIISYTPSYVHAEDYEPFRYVIGGNDLHLNGSQEKDVESVIEKHKDALYGKKWVACGDSFTHGDYTDSREDYVFNTSPYAGELMVYPFFIGRRNQSMTIVNEAINGSTMAHTDRRNDAFVDGRYSRIDGDADYITLKFGINDSGYNVPIGSIDDTTPNTFYGAWNIVVRYLLENRPNAKLGIIVTNGSQSKDEYPTAIKNIARKWGVAYLDEAFSDQIGFNFRVNKPFVSDEAKQIAFNKYCVNAQTNHHPNAKAHEYESYIIEQWLRSL